MSITRKQVKAARNLLDWWQSDLAKRVGVSEETIRGFVSGELRASLDLDLDLVLEALESAGVEFVDSGGTPSVRLRKGSRHAD